MMKKVLVCALDWGLGHATRCVPIVRELQKRRADVWISSSGNALLFLRQEFPSLTSFELSAYDPQYSATASMPLKIMSQLPKFIRVVKKEHEQVEKIVRDCKIDIVISDNRYGCWSSNVKSIFITHQANLLMPPGFGWLAPPINLIGYQFIKKFQEVWIPDNPGSGLTTPFVSNGKLNQKYIGWLSRFQMRKGIEQRYEIIALISGPEPQRTIFENLVTKELKASGLTSLLVEGKPQEPLHKQEGCLEIVNHLATRELEEAILASKLVISRSGYSTVMDLIALGKRAFFVPTPGQTEQDYLARELKKMKVTGSSSQDKFDLADALHQSPNFGGFSDWVGTPDLLTDTIDELLAPNHSPVH